MWMRRHGLGLACLSGLILAAGPGCKKKTASNESPAAATNATASARPASTGAPSDISRIHWLGIKGISGQTNSTNFLAIWNLPESQALLSQTLDKLSVAPWRPYGIGTNSFATNAASAVLRGLLNDLVQEESLIEFRANAAGSLEGALAVKVGTERGMIWETNLQAVLKAWDQGGGVDTRPNGWTKKPSKKSSTVEFTRVGEWVVVGFEESRSELFNELAANIPVDPPTPGEVGRKFWVEGNIDLVSTARALGEGETVTAHLPRVSFVTGVDERGAIRSQAQFAFAISRAFNLPPCDLPTNLIHDPLVSFTVVRGLQDLGFTSAGFLPHASDAFFWAQGGVPFTTYCAVPVTNANEELAKLTNHLMGNGRQWIKAIGMGDLKPLTNGNGIAWVDLPIMAPHLEAISTPGAEMLLAGLGPLGPTNRPGPPELFRQVMGSTNVVYYDWEITASRTASWIEIAQLLRIVFHRPQLGFASPGSMWLKNVGPLLGNAVTLIKQNPTGEFTFARTSTIGLNSVELHVLMDWLESPDFPRGLSTFRGK